MLLGGLWHGAKWNFVIWGGAHGLLLASERVIGKDSIYRVFPRPIRVMLTFIIVLVTWVFFRAVDLTSAARYLAAMFAIQRPAAGASLVGALIYSRDHLIMFVVCGIAVWFGKQSWQIAQKVSPAKTVVMIILFIWALAAMFTQSFNPFLYFQF
jgi:alginate O-acetyltransferase complex protein AlgI